MSELEDRINSVLSDPGQMEKITKLAQSLMGGQGAAMPGMLGELMKGAPDGGDSTGGGMPDMEMLGRIGKLLNSGGAGNQKEQALLEAMKPYLSEKRRSKMDRAIKIARLARLARFAMGETESDGNA